MPGLVGVIGGMPGSAEAASGMARRLGRGVSSDTLHLVDSPMAVMACDSLPLGLWGPKVAAAPDGTVAGINGEIFSLADDAGGTAETFARGADSHPAECLLDLYRRFGTAFIPRLRGAFSLAIWDAPTETLHLATDRYALRPMFYHQRDGVVYFASEVKALLAALPTRPPVDEHGIADYLLLGMPLGGRTFFQGIHLAPPATILSIKEGRCSEKQYWQMRYHGDPAYCGTLEHAADLFAAAFEEAMRESMAETDTVEIPLSGGLDSRCLAAAVEPGWARTYTIGSEGSVDLNLGPLVAQTLGIPNQTWTLAPQDFMDWIPASVYLTDGMYNPIYAPILAIASRLPANARVLLDGTNSFDGFFKFYELFSRHLTPWRYSPIKQTLAICPDPAVNAKQRILASVFSQDFLRGAAPLLTATMEETTGRIPKEILNNPFDTVDYLDQSNRIQRYNILGTVLLRAFCEVRHPFFDQRVVDLVTRFVPLFRSKEKMVMGRFLAKHAPTLDLLHYERTGIRPNSSILRHSLEYGRRAIQRTLGRIAPSFKEKPRIAIDLGQWVCQDAKLQHFIQDILQDDSARREGHFHAPSVEKFVKELFQGRTSHLPLVGRMISLQLWRRFFLEGGSPPAF